MTPAPTGPPPRYARPPPPRHPRATHRMPPDDSDIRSAVRPLRLIFWGALIWILDFKINGFDVLNDLVGAILVAVGVNGFARLRAGEGYRVLILCVRVVAWISVPLVLL